MDNQEILFRSSAVQKLEEGDHGTELCCYPHRIIIDPKHVKALFSRELYRRGTSPRFLNHGNDLMVFADERHRQDWLKSQGYSEGWIAANFLPLAEVFTFPLQRTEDKRQVA